MLVLTTPHGDIALQAYPYGSDLSRSEHWVVRSWFLSVGIIDRGGDQDL